VVLQPFLKRKRPTGKEKSNVSAAEENKAIFRRYAEEVGNPMARPSSVVPRT